MNIVGQTLQVLGRGLRPYFRDLTPLRRASSAVELRKWFAGQSGAGFGFNGDVLRAAVVRGSFEAANCTVFLETGTFRAATTLLAARLFHCPVYTSELNPRFWALAAARCAPMPRVHPKLADSRAFLRDMARALPTDAVPFVYLDAHWNDDLPLQEEIEIIFSAWQRFVVLIDDFQVPEKPGFGFDTYAGRPLSLDTVAFPFDRLEAASALFFPDYDPADETGSRRGYVLLAGGTRSQVLSDRFPLSLLREHPMQEAPEPGPA